VSILFDTGYSAGLECQISYRCCRLTETLYRVLVRNNGIKTVVIWAIKSSTHKRSNVITYRKLHYMIYMNDLQQNQLLPHYIHYAWKNIWPLHYGILCIHKCRWVEVVGSHQFQFVTCRASNLKPGLLQRTTHPQNYSSRISFKKSHTGFILAHIPVNAVNQVIF